MILNYSESKDSQTIIVRKPSTKYLDELLHLRCAGDLLDMQVFPNVKEITESFGAYAAVREHLNPDFNDKEMSVYCVGDGSTPRTGATFAFRSRWRAESIDPQLRPCLRWNAIQRLKISPYRVEQLGVARRAPHAIIVAVHSHANLAKCVEVLRGSKRTDVVAIECCVPQTLAKAPDVEYEDPRILSPKRTVRVWRNVT